MRLLVFQHLDCEHPGSLRKFLAADGVQWDTVELDAGQPIPPLEGYDALWVMGGPMDVWDIEECPWLIPEKQAIRTWVRDLKRPYLGLCLGHQLLADALGGTCGPQRPPEVGVLSGQSHAGRNCRSAVRRPAEGSDLPAMAWRPRRAAAGRCRRSRHVGLPAASRRCASAPTPGRCSITSRSSPTRSTTGPPFRSTRPHSRKPMGPGAADAIKRAADAAMPGFLSNSEKIYRNFRRATA